MTKKSKGNVFFKVDIQPELLARLDVSARASGWSRAQLFREFVSRWVVAWEEAQADKTDKSPQEESTQCPSPLSSPSST